MSRDDIAIASVAGDGKVGTLLRAVGPVLDRVLGIHALARRYEELGLRGLPKEEVARRILDGQRIDLPDADRVLGRVPAHGAAIVVCNHPYGGMEGVAMAHLLGRKRRDVKIMANASLRVVTELQDYFIFTNPLSSSDPRNIPSLRACRRHLREGGLLVVFPAGCVSSFRPHLGRISDDVWNRLPASLALETGAPVTCVFVAGTNRPIFHRLGQVHHRFRLLMLAHEMLALRDRAIPMDACGPIPATHLRRFGTAGDVTALLRTQVYLANRERRPSWRPSPPTRSRTPEPLAPSVGRAAIDRELEALPSEQRLLREDGYSVHWGRGDQIPDTVAEIAMLRERTFRPEQEGSGGPRDTDDFDRTYLHVVLRRDADGAILGAYRLGQTDVLVRGDDLSGLYLSAMFRFGPTFVNRHSPCLELGRSFIVPKFQRSPRGLALLWRGIGELLTRHPRYRTLYGTVSLSRRYSPRAIDAIERALVRPGADVEPRTPFRIEPAPDLVEFLRDRTLSLAELSVLVQTLDDEGKDLPVLVKKYAKLGARFHAVGVDQSFADTPGLLLSVDVPAAPPAYLRRFLGPGRTSYLQPSSP